jgi:hypothetical protein
MADINLSPYTAESEAIARKMRLADVLKQQSMLPIEMPTQPGVHVSPLAGLAKMLQAYKGAKKSEQATQEAKDLADRFRAQGQGDVTQFIEALQGRAAKPSEIVSEQTFTPSGMDLQQAPNAEPLPRTPTGEIEQDAYRTMGQKAVAPNMQRAMALALGSSNPTLQGAGGAMLTNMLKPAESAFAKLNPKDYTPDSVRTFMASGGKDFSLLKPLEKLMTTDTGQVIQGRNPYTFEPVGAPVAKQVGMDTTAQLAQTRELSDRAFSQLSANQKAQLGNEAKRIGISAQQLYFDTGMQAGGNAPVGAPAPTVAPNVAPNAAQRPYTPFNAVPPQGNAPIAPPTNVLPAQPTASKPIIDQVTPKEKQILLVAQPQARTSAETSLQNIDRLINVSKELQDHPGLPNIVGKVNQFSLFDTSKEATGARALQSTLVKQAAVSALQSMREASKTGGAVGAVTEGEWPILEQQLAALDKAQSSGDYKTALTNLQNQLHSSAKRIKSAYESTYGILDYSAPEYKRQETNTGSTQKGAWKVVK